MKLVPLLPNTEGIPRLPRTEAIPVVQSQADENRSWSLLATDLIIDVAWDLIDAVMRFYGGHREEPMPALLSKAIRLLIAARESKDLMQLSKLLEWSVGELGKAVTPLEDMPVLAAYGEAQRLLRYSLRIEGQR
jgi:hypothetical protein